MNVRLLCLRIVLASAILAAGAPVPAIKTTDVELGVAGVYDDKVHIRRSGAGALTFQDCQVPTSVTLQSLTQIATSHGSLSGLSADDHTQYLTAPRHLSVHSADFNSTLPIPTDCNGNVRLGDHVTDSNIHLARKEVVDIQGDWRFTGTPTIWKGLNFSASGTAGDVNLTFEAGAEDAKLSWDQFANRFSLNKNLFVGSTDPADAVLTLGGGTFIWDQATGQFALNKNLIIALAGSNDAVLTLSAGTLTWDSAANGFAFNKNLAIGLDDSTDDILTLGGGQLTWDETNSRITANKALRLSVGDFMLAGQGCLLGTTLSDSAGAYNQVRLQRGSATGQNNLVRDGDILGRYIFEAYDGLAYKAAATIRAVISGTPGNNDLPTKLAFATTPDGSATPVDRLTVSPDGTVNVAQGLTIGTSTVAAAGQIKASGNIDSEGGEIQEGGNALLPAGIICMWSGTIANIPAGWALCDGNNGRPNLLDKFILGVPNGSTNPGTTGGAHTKTIGSANLPPHTHTIAQESPHTHTYMAASTGTGFANGSFYGAITASTGSAGAHDHGGATGNGGFANTALNIDPPYYTLAYIIKL